MKLQFIKILLTGIVAFSFTACNDWLDVSPKSQIQEDDHFNSEGGYRDQLTGVYTAMSTQSMYALNMGIGFTEVLSQNYNIDSNGEWRYPSEYDYTNSACESIIETIWNQTYNCIANLNLVLSNIEEADPNIFSENHYYTYKGEALGLRAFLHLDLMRLFASAPSMDGSANGVPYVTEYSTNVVGQQSVNATMQLIIDDLLEARDCLQHDSLKIGTSPYSQRSERICYFNYYAAVATLARAYLWMGDTENALTYANEIIDMAESDQYSKPFRFVDRTSVETQYDYECDRAFTSEHIFNMAIDDWEDIADYYFTSAGGTSSLSPSTEKAQDIYELSSSLGNDYRYLRGYEQDGENRYLCKFWHYENGRYNDVYPLIRMTEAFYIAAECLKDTDPARAIELLNEVREARNLSAYPLSETLTSDQIQNEIYKEYRKEFVGEGGQLFYYYKRLNASSITGAGVVPSRSVYVLPIPSTDQEFGGYTN